MRNRSELTKSTVRETADDQAIFDAKTGDETPQWLRKTVPFEIDNEATMEELVEHVLQRRYPVPVPPFGELAPHFEVKSGIDRLEFGSCQLRHRPASISRAIEHAVMDTHQVTVTTEMKIGFQPPEPHFDGIGECQPGVLWPEELAPTVCNREWQRSAQNGAFTVHAAHEVTLPMDPDCTGRIMTHPS